MSEKTLIANTGIQFIKFKKKLDNERLRKLKYVYFEDVDINRRRFWLEELIFVQDRDAYAKKSELKKFDLLNEDLPAAFVIGPAEGQHAYALHQSSTSHLACLLVPAISALQHDGPNR